MQKYWMMLTVMSALIATVAIGCKDQSGNGSGENSGVTEDTVKLGLFVSTSGKVSTYGEDTKAGAEMAIAEINKAGGIMGKKIDLVFINTNSKPEEARLAASQLATKDKVLVAMGAVASSLSLAAKPVFVEHKIPMVTPSSTSPRVTKDAPNIFRICYSDTFQGTVCAVFAKTDLKAKKAVVLLNNSNDYSKGLSNYFKAKFKELGGELADDVAFTDGDKDFSSQVTAVKAAGADVVFLPCYYKNVSLIAKKLREAGVTIPLLGGDGWVSSELLPLADGALEGCYFANHYSAEDKRPEVQKFVKAYKEKHGKSPSSLAALGYDVVYAVKNAIEDAGEFDREKITKALAKLKYTGVTGRIELTSEGDAVKAVSMFKISGKDFKFIRQIEPDEIK